MTGARAPLAVWLYGTKIGELTQGAPDRIELTWSADAYDRWGSNSRVVSHLLPIVPPGRRTSAARVKVFIDGLLPEGNARTNYAVDAGVVPDDTYGLISAYGRDTAGALVFQPVDEPEPIRAGHYEPITVADVGRRLIAVDRHSPTDQTQRGDESISLAGMQPKIGLHREGGIWQACKDGAPSTWIIKLAHPDESTAADVIDTEVLSLALAKQLGLTSVDAEIHDFDGVRAIAVSRYDRTRHNGEIGRGHQEDLAQALGINTQDPNRKFQRGNQLPSLALAAGVLLDSGSDPDELLRLVTFNLIIGNTDFHAKNISFLRHDDGTASLSPAYDTAMHLHHRREQPLSALDINGKFRMNDITIDDLIVEGARWGLPVGRRRALVAGTVDALDEAVQSVDLDDHPGVAEEALETVQTAVERAKARLSVPDIDTSEVPERPGRRRPGQRHTEPASR